MGCHTNKIRLSARVQTHKQSAWRPDETHPHAPRSQLWQLWPLHGGRRTPRPAGPGAAPSLPGHAGESVPPPCRGRLGEGPLATEREARRGEQSEPGPDSSRGGGRSPRRREGGHPAPGTGGERGRDAAARRRGGRAGVGCPCAAATGRGRPCPASTAAGRKPGSATPQERALRAAEAGDPLPARPPARPSVRPSVPPSSPAGLGAARSRLTSAMSFSPVALAGRGAPGRPPRRPPLTWGGAGAGCGLRAP